MEKIAERKNKVVYQDGKHVVKEFNENKPVSEVFNEALNLARVNEAGVPSPEPVSVEKKDSSWALTTTYVPGKTLADLMHEHPEKRDHYLEQFVDFQLDIHAHKAPLLQHQTDKYARMIASLTDVLDATARYDLEMRLDGMPMKSKICHGDYNPSNVIVGDDGKFYAVDWAHATTGAGAADAAISYLLFEIEDHDLAEAYLDLYCKKADVPKQIVRDWMPIVAAAELARRRDIDREFLESWINVFDYQ